MKALTETQKNKFCEETVLLKRSLEIGFIDIGARLYRIREERLTDDWESFCEEMQISQATASRLIGIYQKFVLDYNFAPAQIAEAGGWTVVASVLPLITSKSEAIHWLSRAATLTRKDLRIELIEARTGIEQSHCPHPDTFTVKICRTCKERVLE